MTLSMRQAVIWVVVAAMLGALGLFALVVVFGQLRFDPLMIYRAEFTNASGLEAGQFVRIAGVEVGKVKDVSLRDDGTVDVAFGVNRSVRLTRGIKAEIRFQNLVGDRFLALEEGPGSLEALREGDIVPIQDTKPALDIDALIGGFRPLFRALNPEQVNALSGQLLSVFQGQGGTISSVLSHTATLTSTLAGRDQLIRDVIANLNVVMGTFAARDDQFSAALQHLSELVNGLSNHRTNLTNGLAYIETGSRTLADLFGEARVPLKEFVHQTDRSSAQVMADGDYFDNLIKTLPEAYQILNRQGLYGDFFSYYWCDLILKVNGKGGQPVYVKVVSQISGRCAPK